MICREVYLSNDELAKGTIEPPSMPRPISLLKFDDLCATMGKLSHGY